MSEGAARPNPLRKATRNGMPPERLGANRRRRTPAP